MKLFLGIDGGGTKTKVTIIDEHENLLYEYTSGPSSIDTVTKKETYQNFYEALNPYFIKHPNHLIKSVFAGIGGIIFKKDCQLVEKLIKALPFIADDAVVVARNDMENALYSGKCFDEGISLICGTGIVAFGKDKNNSHKASGWGYKEGDLGSAFHLGTEAIRYVVRVFDGRYDIDDFANEVAMIVKMSKAEDIINVMSSYYDNRTKTAALAPIVTKHANLGNMHAKRIIDYATDEAALAVKAVYQKLNFNHKTCVIVGSLGNAKGYYQDELKKKIIAIDSHMQIIEPLIDPSYAAAIMAKKIKKEE